MLDPTRDYTAVQSFELRMVYTSRSIITHPPETVTKGVGTDSNFFRLRQVGNRLQVQIIPWANIDDPSRWTNALNPFQDPIGADIDFWDVAEFSATRLIFIYQLTGETNTRQMFFSDSSGWSVSTVIITVGTTAHLAAIPYYGKVEIDASPNDNNVYMFIADDPEVPDYIGTYNIYRTDDPDIERIYTFFPGHPMVMVLTTTNQLFYYHGPLANMKYSRPAAADLEFSRAGSTIFCLENGAISQGHHPLHMRTIYQFLELPCAQHAGNYYTHGGVKYTLTHASLGQVTDFEQTRAAFKCTVPILTIDFNPYSVLYLRRNWTDGTSLDSNVMLVQEMDSTIYGTQFTCARVLDSSAYVTTLKQLPLSQPHLAVDYTLPYCPLSDTPKKASIFALLEKYKLIISPDTAELLPIDCAAPTNRLTYQLYTDEQTGDRQIDISWMAYNTSTGARTITTETIPGSRPAIAHDLNLLTTDLARTDLVSDFAFNQHKITVELPPQHFQIGDQVITNDAETQGGFIVDLLEKFTANKWRQYPTLLLGTLPGPASLTVTPISTSTSTAHPGTTITWSHTVASGNNRLLIVTISKRAYANADILTVTYGSQSLTKLGTSQRGIGNYPRVEIWYLVAPTVGTANVVVTANASDYMCAGATNFTNVNQTNPLGTIQTANGAASPATVTVPTSPTNLVIDVVCYEGSQATPAQTSLWADSPDGNWRGGSSKLNTNESAALSWTIPSGGWAQAAVDIQCNYDPNNLMADLTIESDTSLDYYLNLNTHDLTITTTANLEINQ